MPILNECPKCAFRFVLEREHVVEYCDPKRDICFFCGEPLSRGRSFLTGQKGVICIRCIEDLSRELSGPPG
jgi:hypothetical protein